MQQRGFVLVGTGERYIREIKLLITNIRKYYPKFPIAIFTDTPVSYDGVINQIIPDPTYSFWDKIRYMYKAPFDECVFLDTDIYLTGPVDELFMMLEHFDLIAPHAPIDENRSGLPDSFAELNTGVIGFKKSLKMQTFFQKWDEIYGIDIRTDKSGFIPPDQPSFRETLYFSSLSFCMLPHEYNCMLDYPTFLSGEVRILHGRKHDKEKMSHFINHELVNRVYIPSIGLLYERDGQLIVFPLLYLQ